jgi:hypothetical protein
MLGVILTDKISDKPESRKKLASKTIFYTEIQQQLTRILKMEKSNKIESSTLLYGPDT